MSTPSKPLSHLHYGGSISPTGKLRPGLGEKSGNHFKRQQRYELIVRLENAQIGLTQIAAMLCISRFRLDNIRKHPDYLAARMKITHGIILDNTKDLAVIKEQRKEMLTQMLPPALQTLANELQTPAATLAERKHKVEVARDILDREGTFAKVSRTEIKPVDMFDFEEADNTSRSIINAIRGVAAPKHFSENGTDTTIEAARAFSSGETLSAESQQQALEELEKEVLLEMETPSTLEN